MLGHWVQANLNPYFKVCTQINVYEFVEKLHCVYNTVKQACLFEASPVIAMLFLVEQSIEVTSGGEHSLQHYIST